MISPLVYIFAAAAGVVALLFVASALLTYRHASTRSKRASDLRDYLAVGGPPSREVGSKDIADTHKRRARVVHVTIGDLIRDKRRWCYPRRRKASVPPPRHAGHRWFALSIALIARNRASIWSRSGRPDAPPIRVRLETEAEARAWAEETLSGSSRLKARAALASPRNPTNFACARVLSRLRGKTVLTY